MKPGDLVKHPAGMKNVCKKKYGLGVILQLRCPSGGEQQAEVLWHGYPAYLIYNTSQLETINENW